MAVKKKNSSKSKTPESLGLQDKSMSAPKVDKKLRLNLGTKLKEEILGVATMTISALVMLAIVSHTPSEQPANIMELWRNNLLQNFLGIVGAFISYVLVGYTFGYAFIAVPILFFVYGWLMLTHRSIFLVNPFAFYILTAMVICSAWIALPGAWSGLEVWTVSGFLGGLLAHQLFVWVGAFGSGALWVVVSLVWLIMVTRVSIADLIPAIQNIFLSSYRGASNKITKFKSRQDQLLAEERSKNETQSNQASLEDAKSQSEKPFIPLYLKDGTSQNIENREKEVTVENKATQAGEKSNVIASGAAENKNSDVTFDTGLVQDLKILGRVDKKFRVNVTEIAKLDEEAENRKAEEIIAEKNLPVEVTKEPDLQTKDEIKSLTKVEDETPVATSDVKFNMSDYKDVAKSVFDEEHAGIDINGEENTLVPKVSNKETPKEDKTLRPKEITKTVVMDDKSSKIRISLDENVLDQSEADHDGLDPVLEESLPEVKKETKISPEKTKAEKKEAAKDHDINFDHENQQARKKYKFPSIDLLEPTQEMERLTAEEIAYLDNKIAQIIGKLGEFGIDTKVVATEYGGPVVAIYQLELPSGLKISKITGLEDELALFLKVKSVRMVPVTSKGTIQVEIPKPKASPVLIRSLFEDSTFKNAKHKYKLGLALGKTIDGHIHFEDLAKMPHLLIAGTTGAGKSVGINSIITSLLYQFDPSDVKFVMVDPKKVELALYRKLKNHHLISLRNHRGELIEDVITKPENAKHILKALVGEMEDRYEKLAHANVRNLEDYNKRWAEGRLPEDTKIDHHKLEYIVTIIDELADLMMTAPREIETSITRLAQMARAVGIHLIVATQRPSVDVLTGLIKANFPARIAYQVRSKIDSRTILDMSGAEQLLGKGDMLFLPAGQQPIRIQNAFTSTQETETIVEYIANMPAFPRRDFIIKEEAKEEMDGDAESGNFDELFNQALEIVVRHNQGSASLLQRRLSIGYARAARIIDQLEKAGVVTAQDGGRPRQVLITEDQVPMYLAL